MAEFTSVEAVELLKSSIGLASEPSAGSLSAWDEHTLAQVFSDSVSRHPGVLTRPVNGEPLYLAMASFCLANGFINPLLVITRAFFRYKEVSAEAEAYKRFLLSRFTNTAAIASLLLLPLSPVNVNKLCLTLECLRVELKAWILPGLKFPRFASWCYEHLEMITDEQAKQTVLKIMEKRNKYSFPKLGSALVVRNRLKSAYTDNSDNSVNGSIKAAEMRPDGLLEPKHVTIDFIELIARNKFEVPNEYWLELLSHENYRIRSSAADSLGEYMSIGPFQGRSLAYFSSLKSVISFETWVRVLSAACIQLAKNSANKPHRFEDEQFQQQQMVLTLTQQTTKPKPSQQHMYNAASSKLVYSYLDCFMLQNTFYLKFIDLFKDNNETLCLLGALSFHKVSQNTGKTPWQMCQPFWPSLALRLLKKYDREVVEWVCTAVLRVSRSDFMLQTSMLTVPDMCLQEEETQACEDIAMFKGKTLSVLYFEHAPGIVARLLMNAPYRRRVSCSNNSKDLEASQRVEMAWEYAEREFFAKTKFKAPDFLEVVTSWRIDLIYDIILLPTDKNVEFVTKLIKKIIQAVNFRQDPNSVSKSLHFELLQQMVFKLTTKIGGIMRNVVSRQSLATKISVLNGLEVLVSKILNSDLVASVLRQLTAFLQTALETEVLAETALKMWLSVLTTLEDIKLEDIIDLTISIINDRALKWDTPTLAQARKIVKHINQRVEANPSVFGMHPQCILDPDETSQMSLSYESSFGGSAGFGINGFDILTSLVNRDIENNYLAKQTAKDICAFCLNFQSQILDWALSNSLGHDLLGKTVKMLLKLCSKNDDELKVLSTQALGLLGALDSHNTTIAPDDKLLVIVSNFRDTDEVIEFCKMVVKDLFLPAFEAAIDPSVQRHYAFGIQELLKYMYSQKDASLESLFQDDNLVNRLLPLVKTKYSLESGYWDPSEYPIFPRVKTYFLWLNQFCSDMMMKATEPENAVKIFGLCRKVLRGSCADKSMWEVFFPYAALCAVVDRKESAANRQSFLQEVLLVLSISGERLQPFHERIFAVVDYFNQWVRSRRQTNQKVLQMDELVAEIPAILMAERAFESQAYPRAIRYYEQHLREILNATGSITGASGANGGTEVLQRLRSMYATMQDSDSLEGVSAQIPALSVKQQVLEYEATSQWDAALACYSALPATEATTTAMLECLHRSGREKEVLAELEGGSVDTVRMAPLGAQCAWTVRDWELLEKWTKLIDCDVSSANSQIPPGAVKALGNSLLALKEKDQTTFVKNLETAREHVGKKLGGVVSTHHVTSLRQVSDLTVFLHGLADLESLAKLVMPDDGKEVSFDLSTSQEIRNKLNGRLKVLNSLSEGPEFEARRYLLSLRGAALSCTESVLPGASQLVAETHLEISSAARRHHQPTIALTEISIAKELGHANADAEHARLFWSLGDTRAAMKTIYSLIPEQFFKNPKNYPEYAELALEWTRWREITAQSDASILVEQYTSIIKAAPKWGHAQYVLAKYFVKNLDSASSNSRDDGVLARSIVYHFSKALELGTDNITEALPKMLTTWLDLGIVPPTISSENAKSRRIQLQKANKDIASWGEIIAKRLIYTAIPQLLSRQNHPNQGVKSLVEQLVAMVVVRFHFHALWPVLEKGNFGKKIVLMAIERSSESTELQSLVNSASLLVEKLKVVCAAKPRARIKQVRVRDLGEDFAPCLHRPQLAVPVQQVMNGLEKVQLYEIEEYAAVQQSLQRPKRITVWGTNGEKYQLLLKGNDDVRKDARLIEFTTAANQLLQTDPAASARYLEIVTYRVTPLNERAGIIEWVQGAKPARAIIQSLSRASSLGTESSFVKRMINVNLSLKERMAAYMEMTKEVPPVLYEWFLHTFPDPEAWLNARTRYARSLAVMSMLGYVLGLGDRHLENILLVQNSGSVLHVDFDCIFNKGEKLNVPELVPFRLTPQFKDALGIVNGYEGPFRKVCELTLKILRDNEDLLMVILESFVYDPVVQDRSISLPVDALANARSRIRGIIRMNTAPLGVSGLVDELIHSATAPENLCRMFRGWMPWI